ncbi:MAG: septum formation initiator family protein [Acidobacteriota bacterium]|nr:MAG: septum formation initiator family protein [Acidobacteriota bacterium]
MNISRKARNELFWIFLLVTCISICYVLVFGNGGYRKLQDYREELRQLQVKNIDLRRSHQELREDIHRLRTDPYEIERIAREKYNLARPGDVIVNLP